MVQKSLGEISVISENYYTQDDAKAEAEFNQFKAKELEQQHLESIKELDADLRELQQKNTK